MISISLKFLHSKTLNKVQILIFFKYCINIHILFGTNNDYLQILYKN